jgi:recombination protein RecA
MVYTSKRIRHPGQYEEHKMETNYESISAIINKINKKQNDVSILRADAMHQQLERTTTGILAYDLMLGGGWPSNQWSEIIGDESSGKTAIAFKTIAANQALDPEWTAVWVAAEEFVPDYAQAIGVDLSRLWVIETNNMEQAYNLVIELMHNRAADCVVIDSLPALVPSDESERAMDEFTVGLGARITSKFFRKSSEAQKRSMVDKERSCTGLMINQWRQKIGVMWGDNRTTPGGLAKNFSYFVRVEVRRDEWLKDKDEIIGQTIKARTLKNKTYKPSQQAVVDFYFTDTQGFSLGSFDTLKDMLNIAAVTEIITRAGAYYDYAGQRWQGKDKMLEAFREDLQLQSSLKKDIEAYYKVIR